MTFILTKAIAYGALTSLNPAHGLYTSFLAGIIYFFFGTSKHLSVGTFAITSLMVYSTIFKLEPQYKMNKQNSLETTMIANATVSNRAELDPNEIKLKIATALAFWSGIIQVILFI